MAGNLSVSSLLNSAEARRNKIQEQEDAIVEYEFSLSAKTYEDFLAYSQYLNERAGKTGDVSRQLSYHKKINSARSAYTSNEIQRQTISIMEGSGNLQTKYDKLIELYYQAADAGNYDLAQNLRSQIDSVNVQMQNEQERQRSAGQGLARQMAALRVDNVKDAVSTLKSYMDQLNDLYKTAGTKRFTEEIQTYAKELGISGDAGFFDVYANLAVQAVDLYDQALAAETDPGNLRTLQGERNKLISGEVFSLPGKNGNNIKLSFQDIQDQIDANRVGEVIFKSVQTAEGTVFEKNKKTGFTWGRDAEGNYRQIAMYNPKQDFTSNVYSKTKQDGDFIQYMDNEGKIVAVKDSKTGEIQGVGGRSINDASKSNYEDLLKANGFTVTNTGENLSFQNTGNLAGFYGSPFPTGQDVQVYTGENGELQITDGDKVYNLNFDQDGKFQGLQEYLPNPLTYTEYGGATPREFAHNREFLATQGYDQNAVAIISQAETARQAMMRGLPFNLDQKQIAGLNIPQFSKPVNLLQPTVGLQRQAPAPQQTVNPMNIPAPRGSSVRIKAPAPRLQKNTPRNPTTSLQPTANPFSQGAKLVW